MKGDFPPISNKTELRKKLQLPESDKLIILQGAGINIQRGAEEAVLAMQFLENTTLLIVGGGDVLPVLKGLVNEYRLENKIIFKPRLPYTELMQHTRAADLGLTLDKDTNINYRFSLPNKIFDYIHAGIPVLASRLPEVERIIAGYGVGDFIERHDPKHIAEKMESMLQNESALAGWRKNLEIASHELNWDEEKKKFPKILNEQY
ncbi:MAG: glycosyltransferase [Bacteroidetes bacterium]|nr:glycosyltransferase [Bacteroidota bacterium]